MVTPGFTILSEHDLSEEFSLSPSIAYGSMRSTASCEQEKRIVAPPALATGVVANAAAATRDVKCILT